MDNNYLFFGGKSLNDRELGALRALEGICNEYEGLRMRLNWGEITERSPDEMKDFLCFEKDGMLVGYLQADGYGGSEIEIAGMVHPDHRRRGIFSKLLKSALLESAKRGSTGAVIINERISSSGSAFVKTLDALPDRSEHKMELKGLGKVQACSSGIRVVKADKSDIPFLAHLDAQCFNMPEEEAVKFHDPSRLNRNSEQYIASAQGTNIGAFRLHKEGRDIMIFGVAILPEYRGRGLGRGMLDAAIGLALEKRPEKFALEVDCENNTALSLYKSCGFEIVTTYDYFRLCKHCS